MTPFTFNQWAKVYDSLKEINSWKRAKTISVWIKKTGSGPTSSVDDVELKLERCSESNSYSKRGLNINPDTTNFDEFGFVVDLNGHDFSYKSVNQSKNANYLKLPNLD